MRNSKVRVFVTMAMSLVALLGLPTGRKSAAAQNWEVGDRGIQMAFDRRDDEGRIYYQFRWSGLSEYYAADCSKVLLYRYSKVRKNWETAKPGDGGTLIKT